jgi:hypothetical protein
MVLVLALVVVLIVGGQWWNGLCERVSKVMKEGRMLKAHTLNSPSHKGVIPHLTINYVHLRTNQDYNNQDYNNE